MKQTIHGNLVVVNGVGILIIGDAGSGKTTVCLELADRRHNFIADDAVVIEKIGERVVGEASPVTWGRMNVKGKGISRIPYRSDRNSNCEIAFVVEIGREKCSGDSRGRQFHFADLYDELLNIPKVGLLRHTSTLAIWIEELTKSWRADENTIRTFPL